VEIYGCMVCDTPIFHSSGRGRKPRYCSSSCQSKAREFFHPSVYVPKPPRDPADLSLSASIAATARWAGTTPEARSKNSKALAAARWAGHEAPPKRHLRDRACEFCGEVVPMKSNQRCCGKPECRLAKKSLDMRVGGWMKARRAQQFTTQVGRVDVLAVFIRDEWTCGICGGPVDPSLKWPDRMSASLDHIVPLSKGGAHVMENVRCTHLTCNVSRGNRMDISLVS
jgi:hypothetical protein